jgi:2-polyprenyl-3-methyl-5-hydroxy-6-metoxy-1,4-benzoquinol methylase
MNNSQLVDYGWESAETPHSCAYIAPEVFSILRRLGVNRVLDIGSGNGDLCNQLSNAGYDVVGMEVDQRGIEISRAEYPEIKFYQLNVEDDPQKLLDLEERFEVVVSTEVIEHLYAPHKLISFADAVLRDGGNLIISTPYHGYLKNLAISVLNKWDFHFTTLRPGGHIKFFSKKTLTELLHQNGFQARGFSGVGRLPYLWKSMIITAQKI